MSKTEGSEASAGLAQTVPKPRIAAGVSREKSFPLVRNFRRSDFHPTSELKKKKSFEKKTAFEIMNPISVSTQINRLHPKKEGKH